MVLNGMIANQTTFNTGFVSRTAAATSTAAILSLLNTAIASGASVNNVQALLNKIIEGLGTTGELDAAINDYASNNYVVDGQSRKEAIETLDAQLGDTQADLDIAEANIVSALADIATLEADVNTINNLPSTFAGDKTFTNNVIVNGNMTVNGTTTTINSATVDSVDPNITINKTGNDATSEGSGFTVDRTGTKGSFVYQNALAARFKVGDLGAEAEVATVSHTQTFTNKTLTSPIVNGGTFTTVSLVTPNVDIITATEQGATPATPAAGKRKLYPKADGFYQLDSAGLETKVGSGSGSGGAVNLIPDGDAEQGIASYVEGSYAAASRPAGTFTPSAGTGALELTVTTTDPINTTKSFLITKYAGASRQGRAIERTITLDREYRTKVLKMRVKFSVVSGTFVAGATATDSSMIWYIGEFNGTTWTYTEPSSFKALSNSALVDYVDGTFQVNADTTQIKLISYVAETANSTWVLMCEYEISPSTYTYGTPITDFKTVTNPTIVGSSSGTYNAGTGATYITEVASSGQEWLVNYYIDIGTAATDIVGAHVFNLPAECKFHSDVQPYEAVGYGEITNVATANPVARMTAKVFGGYTSNQVILDRSDAELLNVASGFMTNSSYIVTVKLKFKGMGLSSSVKMSDGYEGRVLTAKMINTASQSIANDAFITMQATVTSGTGGIDVAASGVGTIRKAGWYQFQGRTEFVVNATGIRYSALFKNSTEFAYGTSVSGDGASQVKNTSVVAGCEYFNAGDTFSYQVYQNSGGALALQSSRNYLTVQLVDGPQTISAASKEIVAAVNNSGQAFTSLTTLTGWTVEANSHGNFNPTTGVWTCSSAGPVNLTALITMATPTSGDVQVDIWKNAAMVRQYLRPFQVAGSNLHTAALSYSTNCIAGDTLYLRAAASSATALSANNRCSINVTRG